MPQLRREVSDGKRRTISSVRAQIAKAVFEELEFIHQPGAVNTLDRLIHQASQRSILRASSMMNLAEVSSLSQQLEETTNTNPRSIEALHYLIAP